MTSDRKDGSDNENEDSGDEELGDDESTVLIGTLTPVRHHVRMRRQYFPSKCGGKPVSAQRSALQKDVRCCRRG